MGIKAIVLILLTVIYLYETALNVIKMRSVNNPVPENVAEKVYEALHAEE